MQNSIRRLLDLTIATALFSILGPAAGGFAATVSATGGVLLQVDTRSNRDGITTTSDILTSLPEAQIKIKVPAAGGSRLIVARFSAASNCAGASWGFCSARIVALNSGTNVITELHPQGVGGNFDSVASTNPESDYKESHSIERSIRLNPGNYAIRVQWSVSGQNNVFAITDWHLTVSQYD
jgi:hypothetical protein